MFALMAARLLNIGGFAVRVAGPDRGQEQRRSAVASNCSPNTRKQPGGDDGDPSIAAITVGSGPMVSHCRARLGRPCSNAPLCDAESAGEPCAARQRRSSHPLQVFVPLDDSQTRSRGLAHRPQLSGCRRPGPGRRPASTGVGRCGRFGTPGLPPTGICLRLSYPAVTAGFAAGDPLPTSTGLSPAGAVSPTSSSFGELPSE
jgi:hypothetical protein